mmetsp:Transcript_59051/g.175581  ORF Transcript_59051/g.175581 Transcript_59051/m.175581 type:complete len:136 (+) Transcript_59051:448-855(+)
MGPQPAATGAPPTPTPRGPKLLLLPLDPVLIVRGAEERDDGIIVAIIFGPLEPTPRRISPKRRRGIIVVLMLGSFIRVVGRNNLLQGLSNNIVDGHFAHGLEKSRGVYKLTTAAWGFGDPKIDYELCSRLRMKMM